MRRRTLLQSLAGLAAFTPFGRLELFAQASALNDTQITTLRALAEVVLPAALGAGGREEATRRFVQWIRNYREDADRGHGYGASRLLPRTGPSPATHYAMQFAALDTAAAAHGATKFAALPRAARRAVVEATLEGPPRVTALPARPNGNSLIADFMGLYFNSPDAIDLAYNAEIRRDDCRGLDGSDKAPVKRQ
jgi:hypothetical protein